MTAVETAKFWTMQVEEWSNFAYQVENNIGEMRIL